MTSSKEKVSHQTKALKFELDDNRSGMQKEQVTNAVAQGFWA